MSLSNVRINKKKIYKFQSEYCSQRRRIQQWDNLGIIWCQKSWSLVVGHLIIQTLKCLNHFLCCIWQPLVIKIIKRQINYILSCNLVSSLKCWFRDIPTWPVIGETGKLLTTYIWNQKDMLQFSVQPSLSDIHSVIVSCISYVFLTGHMEPITTQ